MPSNKRGTPRSRGEKPPATPDRPRSRSSGNKPMGDRGEQLAAGYLAERGWVILHRNYRIGHREIDLVARRNEVVAFVEVKTRGGLGYGHPLEAITRKKRGEIQRVAAAWVKAHGLSGDVYRFDAVAVLLPAGGEPVIEHVEDAWRMW
jgi:putative endonuclease